MGVYNYSFQVISYHDMLKPRLKQLQWVFDLNKINRYKKKESDMENILKLFIN